ncbi:CGLD27 family protein [filamentous cyanobacterium LEGE 11480]|uniref:CGLD27 family protein n=1 Tax=Romeriopsis navalis LEGE 11480 TaxID=2777977 RepID=A0A928VSZ3_9CYAN|nr:CGLD27 family protein [Romeriopsis navalis]MBE9031524.1 CGLD27 family protein [Romeriopsis navalis LEGE 11480]
MKSSSSSPCPVPDEQRPINEYRALADSWYFRWGTLEPFEYFKPIGLMWLSSWLISGPVSAASFVPQKYPIEFAGWAMGGACIIPVLAVIRLYLGWSYIQKRLFSTKILYEESGWYDGQVWEKQPEMLDQDRLIALYEVQPLLQRMQVTIGACVVLCAISVSGAIAWHAWH